jgi:DNA polymerase I-like protein with 3'-5' exonuclease and polymerase domains
VGDHLRQLVQVKEVVFQNTFADLPVLRKNVGIKYEDYKEINDTMLAHAVLYSELPHDLEFLASLYSQHPKLKHLNETDPLLYNFGDVLATIDVWEGLKSELDRDPLSFSVYRDQSLKLIPIIDYRHERGIKVNQTGRVEEADQEYSGKMAQAQLLAQAGCGWPINVGSDDQLKFWLYDVEGLPIQKHKETRKPTTDQDAIAALRELWGPTPDFEEEEKEGLTWQMMMARLSQGAHPVLEARAYYAGAQQAKSNYIDPLYIWNKLDGKGKPIKKHGHKGLKPRIYPEFKIHAQASGRWSTTNPPMAQLPNDLRDLVVPDEGQAWIGWDWSNIENFLLAYLTGDEEFKTALLKRWDLHTLNFCDLFGFKYPPVYTKAIHTSPDHEAAMWRETVRWLGEDDPRRKFSKIAIYRWHYRGRPDDPNIPGAKRLGLDKTKIQQMSARYLSKRHKIKAYWDKQDKLVMTTRMTRTFMGRRRVHLGDPKGAIREGSNHPLQGGVADIFNLTLVKLIDQFPYLSFVFQMHDSVWLACPLDKVPATQELIKPIVEQAWTIQGQQVHFPASFKTRE